MDMAEEYIRHLDEEMAATEGFSITDDGMADWALRKIAQARRNISRRGDFVAGEMTRLREWQEREDKRDQGTIEYMESLLRRYFDSLRQSGALGKRKSYSLPSGVLQVRTAQVSYVRDEEQLLPYARQVGLVRVKETPEWSEIRKRLQPAGETPGAPVVDAETGEIVPGVTVAEVEREVFSTKVDVGVTE